MSLFVTYQVFVENAFKYVYQFLERITLNICIITYTSVFVQMSFKALAQSASLSASATSIPGLPPLLGRELCLKKKPRITYMQNTYQEYALYVSISHHQRSRR